MNERAVLLVAFLRPYTYDRRRQGVLLALSLSSFRAPTPPLAMHHVLCVTLHRTRLSEPTRTINIAPLSISVRIDQKVSGIIRSSNNVVGGGYRDHRDNVASPDHTIAAIAFPYLRHARRVPLLVLQDS